MAVVNTGMPKSDMKRLLNKSKDEPVNCAVGIGENQAFGLLLMSKTKGPKILEKTLMLEFKAKSTRFGTAFVDVEENPKLVKLSLNRNVTGMPKKLIKSLKGTGFTKVVLVFEDGSPAETHEEEDEEAPEGIEATAAAPAEAVAAAPPPPPPGPPPAAKTPEEIAAQTSALSKVLASLAPLIAKAAGDDAERKAMLMKLATDANVNIKTGNLKTAGGFLEQLKREVTAAAPQQATLQTLTASRQQWTGTQEKIRAEVDKLKAALNQTYQGQAFAKDIETRFQAKVAPVIDRFDDRLLDVLDDMMNTKDAAERTKLVTDARGLIKEYVTFAASDTFIADLDANPFVPLTIKSTVLGTLAQLEKATH